MCTLFFFQKLAVLARLARIILKRTKQRSLMSRANNTPTAPCQRILELSRHLRSDVTSTFRLIKSTGSQIGQTKELIRYLDCRIDHLYQIGVIGPIIFDIDDTLVRLKLNPQDASDFEEIDNATVMDFFKKWVSTHPIYICTARPRSTINKLLTESMLEKKGLIGYSELYMMPTSEQRRPDWKWRVREIVQAKHPQTPILARIGDMLWDAAPFPYDCELLEYDGNAHNGAIIEAHPDGEIGCLLPSGATF